MKNKRQTSFSKGKQDEMRNQMESISVFKRKRLARGKTEFRGGR